MNDKIKTIISIAQIIVLLCQIEHNRSTYLITFSFFLLIYLRY